MITEREGMRLLADIVRKEKRQRQRREAAGKFGQAFARWLFTFTSTCLMTGLWLMLAVGVIHHEWIPQCPTLGYWWSVLLAYLLQVSLTRATPPSKTKAATDA
jgi:hypothetical protein